MPFGARAVVHGLLFVSLVVARRRSLETTGSVSSRARLISRQRDPDGMRSLSIDSTIPSISNNDEDRSLVLPIRHWQGSSVARYSGHCSDMVTIVRSQQDSATLADLPPELLIFVIDHVVDWFKHDIESGEFRPACQSLLDLLLVNHKFHDTVLSRHRQLLRVTLPTTQMNLFRSIASAARNSRALLLAQTVSSIGSVWRNSLFVHERQAQSNMLSALVLHVDALKWFIICFPGMAEVELNYTTSRVLDLQTGSVDDQDIVDTTKATILAVGCIDERFPESRGSFDSRTGLRCSLRVEVWHDFRFCGTNKRLRHYWHSLAEEDSGFFRRSWIWMCRRTYTGLGGPEPITSRGPECLFFYDPETGVGWLPDGHVIAQEDPYGPHEMAIEHE